IDKDAWMRQNRLDPNRPTILMSAGAFGVSKGFESMIADILERTPETQVVMVCGRNKELKRNLKHQFKGNHNVLILGYTHHMNEWMAASNL
ncbi:hypothetical protein NL503_27940, partial [Klebsiella pneumoniae]|nr:hypothetical protein [Klebsiella pneumoniae]